MMTEFSKFQEKEKKEIYAICVLIAKTVGLKTLINSMKHPV